MAKKIIIVTGTPGVGKTRLARGIGKKTRLPVVSLGELVKKNSLHKGFDRRRQSYVIDGRKVRDHIGSLSKRSAQGLVIDTHLIDRIIPKAPRTVAIVLRLDPLILSKRLRQRGWKKRKVWENVEAEMIDLSLFDTIQTLGKNNVHEIDSTGKSASTVLFQALRMISQRKPKKHGRVNWLAKYDPIEVQRRL